MAKHITAARVIFGLVAGYDGVLGAGFLFAHGPIFDAAGVTRPNHPGYVQFAAAILLIFAIMFARVAADPVRSRELMLYGVLLKVAYAGVVFGHLALGSIPSLWVPFAIADAACAVAFLWCFWATGRRGR